MSWQNDSKVEERQYADVKAVSYQKVNQVARKAVN